MRIGRLYRRSVVLAGAVIVVLVLALDAIHGLHGLDLSSIDWRFDIRGSQAPHEVVVVGIDDHTFTYLNAHDPSSAHYPFKRRLDATVIANLRHAGAKVIAYDIQFTESTDPTDDNDLILAVRRAGNVVLATTEATRTGKTGIFGGGAGLTYSRAAPADSQFPVDSDGEIRRMRDQISNLPTMAIVAAEKALGRPIRFPGGRNATALIDFRGPAGTIPSYSYSDVLSGNFNPSDFRGKIVVVGATEPILHDIHAAATDDQMTGAEVQANAIDTALSGFPLRPDASWLNVALVIILGLAAPLLALRLGAPMAAGAAFVLLIAFAVACQLAFNGGTVVGFVYPIVAGAASILATLLLDGARAVYEREQTRDAFARFVPESVVSEVLAQADGLRLGGVRRHATVLFSDLRGFTTFSEGREPDETIEILNRYLTAMTDAILEHGGTLVSYMGDGIMAVFGAPLEQSDHADRAIAAARDMLHRMVGFNQSMQDQGKGDGFKMGIGLNTGDVMSGNVGSERRLEYTTIGDTTNTASRIEGMTKGTPHQLFIAESTYAGLQTPPDDLVVVGDFPVRGRAVGVTIWGLAEVEAAPEPPAAPDPAQTPSTSGSGDGAAVGA
jgi:adenylate cyclase